MNITKKGFTLIELLVVISIIGLLAASGLAVFTSAMQRGRDARRLSDIDALKSALFQYYTDHGEFPDETGPLGVGGWETSYNGDFMEYLAPYMQEVPVDPLNTIKSPFDFFSPGPGEDGSFFYAYHNYNWAGSMSYYGCGNSGTLAVLAIRAFESIDGASQPHAKCGPIPCLCAGTPCGGNPNVCRDWTSEYDYSIILQP